MNEKASGTSELPTPEQSLHFPGTEHPQTFLKLVLNHIISCSRVEDKINELCESEESKS
jgi:hypothetical protein